MDDGEEDEGGGLREGIPIYGGVDLYFFYGRMMKPRWWLEMPLTDVLYFCHRLLVF